MLSLFIFLLRYSLMALASGSILSYMILGLTQHGCTYFLSRGKKEKKKECATTIQEVLWRQYLGNILFWNIYFKKIYA